MSAFLNRPLSFSADADQSAFKPVAVSYDQQQFFTRSDHAARTLTKLSSFLRREYLCDVAFICQNHGKKRRVVAHRLMVSTISDYFPKLFESNKQTEIVFNDIDAEILERIISYAYEGSVEINANNAIAILSAAHQFSITEIVNAAVRFLEKQLQPKNCLGIYQLALEHKLNDFAQTIWNYILDHFADLIDDNPEFLQLSFDQLKRLLASDQINVPSEERVYQALCVWLDHDRKRCQDRLGDLFALIRLPLLERRYLTMHVDGNERFQDDRTCQMLIFETMRYHLAPEKRSTMQLIRTKPRKSTLGSLICFGGSESTKNSPTIERYDFRSRTWRIEDSMNSRRCQFACVRLDEKLYLCGGREGLKTLNSVEIYDIPTKTWSIGAPMLNNRHDLAAAAIGYPFYALGGHDGRTYLNSVERYDPDTTVWSYVASMNYTRCTFGVAALDQKLYAVGGRDVNSSLREVEFFDPHTNRWTQCASMQKRRDNVAVASCNGFIYAMGGHDSLRGNKNPVRHDDAERYDPRSNQWTIIPSFSRPKEGLGIAVVENRLYIVGGFDGKALDEMECFDTETDRWKKCSSIRNKRDGPCLLHIPNSIYDSNRSGDTSAIDKHQVGTDRPFSRLLLS